MSAPTYGLKKAVLSGNETLAQSIALIAPTAAPLLTIPLVYASAGSGTWLAFAFAMFTIVLVALNINHFARVSASPGSLYTYIAAHMHPAVGMLAAWSLLVAYIGTATAIAGGLTNYTNVVLLSLFRLQAPPILIAALAVAAAVWLAYRDVTVSARLMLGLEAVSMLLIAAVAIGVMAAHGFHLDRPQLTLQGVTAENLRLGLVLAIFCSVGFESATSLGSEARNPLRNIPRAVLWSGIIAGLFFIFCAYVEVLGFRGQSESLDKSAAPMNFLARAAGMPAFIGIVIDLGAMVSFFSCLLACITAGARVLFLMARRGALHALLGEAHAANRTPHRAVVAAGLAVFLPLAALIGVGMAATDVYGLLGTLATFGFLTAYVLICLAALLFLRSARRLTAGAACTSLLALIAMGIALAGSIYPVPAPPYSYLPYIYSGLILIGLASSLTTSRSSAYTAKLHPIPD